jgi:hypothetical protein
VRGWAYVALGALVFAYAFLIQPTGDNQKAHYALVRALADGRATVDEVRTNPNLRTIDVTEHDGHLYAAKSPGYALFSLPAYVVLEWAGVDTDGDTKRILWALHLWATVLPALALLLVVRHVADDVEPGLGIAAAVLLGVSTLLLPFATLFFSHVFTAALAFGAFALLWFDRPRGPRPWVVAASGLLAGFAAATEASVAIAAVVLGAYAGYGLARSGWPTRALAFAGAFALGLAPSPVFNWWALGSPLRSPYEGWHYPGQAEESGSFGFGVPTPNSFLLVLLYPTGLVLLAAGVAGSILLLRRRRAEATVILSVAAAFVLANSMSPDALGGAAPGPRYLVPVFPFFAAGLAVALRRFRGETVGLALAGATMLGAATITSPLGAFDQHVIQRLRAHSVVDTALELVGFRSGYAVLVFVAAVGLAIGAAARAATLTLAARDALPAAVTAAVFAVVATQTPRLLSEPAPMAELAAAAAIVAGGVAAVAAARRLASKPPRSRGTMEPDRAL